MVVPAVICIVSVEMMIVGFLITHQIHLMLRLVIPTILHGMMDKFHGKTLSLC